MPQALPPQDDPDLVFPDLRPTRPTQPLTSENEKKSRFGILPCQRKCVQKRSFFRAQNLCSRMGETMPIRVKVSCVAQLTVSREVTIERPRGTFRKTGTSPSESSKNNSRKELDGFPDATNMQLLWFAKVLGRKYDSDDLPQGKSTDHLNEYIPDEHKLTLNDYNVIPWLLKFPDWEIVATVLDRAPARPLRSHPPRRRRTKRRQRHR